MVKVKLFGLIRLDTGIKELDLEVNVFKDIYHLILEEAKKRNPMINLSMKDLESCVIIVNNKQVNKNYKLKNGDVISLMSPVCGG